MTGTDFDSLQGQWAAQRPNLYLLSRIHVRPEMPVDGILDEYYAAFGPASSVDQSPGRSANMRAAANATAHGRTP